MTSAGAKTSIVSVAGLLTDDWSSAVTESVRVAVLVLVALENMTDCKAVVNCVAVVLPLPVSVSVPLE